MRRDYELGFILNPEVSEEQTSAILERIEKIVKNYDGQVVKVNQWGRRRLAYPIDHHRDGYYVFIDMILTPETVLELDRTLKVSEEVMRHLVKRRDPKAVQKEREEREARAAAAATQTQTSTTAEIKLQLKLKSQPSWSLNQKRKYSSVKKSQLCSPLRRSSMFHPQLKKKPSKRSNDSFG